MNLLMQSIFINIPIITSKFTRLISSCPSKFSVPLLNTNTLKLSKGVIEITGLSNITLKHPYITENCKTYSIKLIISIIIALVVDSMSYTSFLC